VQKSLIGVPLLCETVWLVCPCCVKQFGVPLLYETVWMVWLYYVIKFDWCAYVLSCFFASKCHYMSLVVEMCVQFVGHFVIFTQFILIHCAVSFAPWHLRKVLCYMLAYINTTWNNNAEELMSTFDWVRTVKCHSLRCPASSASRCELCNNACLNFFGFSCAAAISSKELCISLIIII